jgi:D-inositol-3-phosphate glycosyltransferase
MNVYVANTARQMAELGVEVDIFTRSTTSELPPTAELAPGVTVHHVSAGPYENLDKSELPSQLCAFTAEVMRAQARHRPGYYQAIHAHYWLSGQVGWLTRERWGVPLIFTPHTLGRVKNASLAAGETPEPRTRLLGEQQVINEADRLVVNTDLEASQVASMYDADSCKVEVVPPGVDLETFWPGDGRADRAELGLAQDAIVLAFVGRIQPLKAPDVLLEAAASLLARRPELAAKLVVLVAGGPSGTGLAQPTLLVDLADKLGITPHVRFLGPRSGTELAKVYRAADVVVVPSFNESFGLVALEAQACGTPVLAAKVGGLPVAVADGVSGELVVGHDPRVWAERLHRILREPGRLPSLAAGARLHAERFSWRSTTSALLDVYVEASDNLRARIMADAKLAPCW